MTGTYEPGLTNARQREPHAKRLLAAQSRLYTDAKRLHDTRLVVVVVIAAVAVGLGLAMPDARPAVGVAGTVIGVLWSVLTFAMEKRCRTTAVAIQEEFDTYVFDLPWKETAVEHPSPTDIAEAAKRYKGHRVDDNWYPNTGPVPRPLDILICQRSNLGWGASTHRQYAAFLTTALLVLIGAGIAIGPFANLHFTDWMFVALPLATPAKEIFELARANRGSSDTKARAEAMLDSVWKRGLQDRTTVTIADCRDIQDRILAIRSTNANIPDWFDNRRRNQHESSMTQSAAHLIEEAIEAGQPPST